MQTRAVEFVAPRKVELTELDVPALREGDVLVRTLYSGISSGTETLAYRGDIDPELPLDETLGALGGTFSYPFKYGYSCVGRVEDSRASVPKGALVFAFHPHQEVLVQPSSDVVVLADVDPRIGTLFPIVETALQVSLDAGPVQQEIVVVVGLGPVGILVAGLLSRAGARVVAAEPRSWRRAAAEAFGVEAMTPDDLSDVVAERTCGAGAPLVIEASGDPRALTQSLRLLGHEGRALVVSWYGRKDVSLPLGGDFHRRRLTITSSQVSTIPARLTSRWNVERRRKVVRSLLAELPLERLATHEFAFTEAPLAFDAVEKGVDGLIHAALRYE